MDFEINLPYPKVEGSARCVDVSKLMEAYSGRNSECTAILQYSYQNYVFEKDYPELVRSLREIAVCEMKHHRLLGEAIVCFGGDPIIAGRFSFFNGSYLNYIKGLKNAIRTDIAGEKLAISGYREIISTTENRSLRDLIERITMDEELHLKFFCSVLESIACD